MIKGPFTNYVYKRRGVGGQKKKNLVNVVCERPLIFFLLGRVKDVSFQHTVVQYNRLKSKYLRI